MSDEVTTNTTQNETTTRLLYRSQNRMVAGVAAGIARYFSVDPTLVRVAFVFLGLASGVGVVLYVLLWIMMPESPEDAGRADISAIASSPERRNLAGLVLIFLGLIWILHNFNLFNIDLGRLWPLLLVAVGVAFIWRGRGG
jgi:phage shock protein C